MVPVGGHTPGSYVVLLDEGGDTIRGPPPAVQTVLDHDPAKIYVGHGGPLAADVIT